MSFHIGQKVMFIGKGKYGKVLGIYPDIIVPKYREIYHVRELTEIGAPGIRLIEIRNGEYHFLEAFAEPAWQRKEFTPVKETDISIFTAMLNKTPELV